ncbi:MAG TPA: DUF6265 family protein [Phenylobacterium sp.]|nr:DUF6265 family protein [Phenylobacterium sp.]
MLAALAAAMAVAAADPEQPSVERLAWISGSWSAEKDGATVREMWLSPLDGAMAGVTLTTRPGQPARAEFAKITAEPGGVTYTAVVGRQAPTPFVLRPGSQGDEAIFENLDHDFPQRIVYRRCGRDLCARIEGVVKGRPEHEEWRYRRAR